MVGSYRDISETHEVINQPPPLEGVNLYQCDPFLRKAVDQFGGRWASDRLHEYGAWCGGEMIALGFQANENLPVLKTHDRYGHRIDEIDFHPAYHRIMAEGVRYGLHCLPWQNSVPGTHAARAALYYLHHQSESGTGCPLTMTYAALPTLELQPEVEAEWKPKFLSSEYDPSNQPVDEKRGATLGMAMTEKQGGSDVRANTTEAHPVSSSYSGLEYELVGHKWFCSAPMSDAFLTLAQTERGLTCFLMPRWRPDGSRNPVLIQRLKDKMGNRSNASAEIEMHGAWAKRVGEEGRGVANIIKMVALTRFDCMVASAALIRQAVLQACHHARSRQVFGRKMLEQELMQNVLADLVIESEAALWFSMRMAHALDSMKEESESRFLRIGVAVGKYALCKTAQFAVAEAQECLGGGGYVEESVMPRLYREAPVNSIWEGSGNVQCLDVLRALKKDPETAAILLSEIEMARGEDKRLDHLHEKLRKDLEQGDFPEFLARQVVGRMATALQAALLIRFGDPDSASAFCASRMQGLSTRFYGNLPSGTPCKAMIERACPNMC